MWVTVVSPMTTGNVDELHLNAVTMFMYIWSIGKVLYDEMTTYSLFITDEKHTLM